MKVLVVFIILSVILQLNTLDLTLESVRGREEGVVKEEKLSFCGPSY